MVQADQIQRGTIDQASWPAEVPLARELFLEYADWLDLDLCFQGFEAELAGLPAEKQQVYNLQRNSKVLIKNIASANP